MKIFKSSLLFVLCSFFGLCVQADDMVAPKGAKVSQYQWKRRVILVSGTKEQFQEQKEKLMTQKAGVLERKILLIHEKAELFASYKLYGMDGAVKKEQSEVFETATLFPFIDRMPLRRQEMANDPHADPHSSPHQHF